MSRERQRGFTLLEVLVAFAIAAFALAVLFRSSGTALMAARTSGQYQEALSRARSHLAALGGDAALVAGESSGDDGGGFRWRLKIEPAGAAVVTPAPAVQGAAAQGPAAAQPAPAVAQPAQGAGQDGEAAPPQAAAPQAAPPQPIVVTLFAVEVGISWTGEGGGREVVLRSQRLAGAPAPQ
jgi:general secretion pathway protein I